MEKPLKKDMQNIKAMLCHESFKEFLNVCAFDFSKGCFYHQKGQGHLESSTTILEQTKWRLLRSGLICGELKKNHFEPESKLWL